METKGIRCGIGIRDFPSHRCQDLRHQRLEVGRSVKMCRLCLLCQQEWLNSGTRTGIRGRASLPWLRLSFEWLSSPHFAATARPPETCSAFRHAGACCRAGPKWFRWGRPCHETHGDPQCLNHRKVWKLCSRKVASGSLSMTSLRPLS
jgi:hypothetical protein